MVRSALRGKQSTEAGKIGNVVTFVVFFPKLMRSGIAGKATVSIKLTCLGAVK